MMIPSSYNANTKPEQLHTWNDHINILGTFKDIQNKSIVLGSDFDVTLPLPIFGRWQANH